jgi:hypothetical protein
LTRSWHPPAEKVAVEVSAPLFLDSFNDRAKSRGQSSGNTLQCQTAREILEAAKLRAAAVRILPSRIGANDRQHAHKGKRNMSFITGLAARSPR